MSRKNVTTAQIATAYAALPDAEKIRRLEQRACAYLDWFADLEMDSMVALKADIIKYEEDWT